jgi:cytidyltransferase-like protein
MNKIVLVTGGFDPIHSGHIEYFKAARRLGDQLVVGINSDAWLARKKGRSFMPWIERQRIIKELSMVDYTIEFNDADGSSKNAIEKVRLNYPGDCIVFANGGDRTDKNIPEMDVGDSNTEFVFGVGGENKMNSSSWILEEWKAPKTQRQWGYYRVLHEVAGTKVKELTVMPGKSLSMQRHFKRAEHWHVSEGQCMIDLGDHEQTRELHEFQHIPVGQWHRLYNPFDMPCRVVEIQYGNDCDEDDIERRE